MPYLVVFSRGQVMERRPLVDSICIGRSAECDLVVRDILLSRAHCRIEPTPDGWLLTDLASKNGTVLDGRRVETRRLRDGDSFRLGKTVISFHGGAMPGSVETETQTAKRQRPLDPTESLANTVWGVALAPEMPDLPDHFANPRPAPPLPAVYERERIHEMLEQIASSSWDSIYAQSRKPARQGETQEVADRPRRRPARPDSVCLSLQVNQDVLESFTAVRRKRRRSPLLLRAATHIKRLAPWAALIGLLRAA